MSARRTTEAVITSAVTQWDPLNAAAKRATNFSPMNGRAKVSDLQSVSRQANQLSSLFSKFVLWWTSKCKKKVRKKYLISFMYNTCTIINNYNVNGCKCNPV